MIKALKFTELYSRLIIVNSEWKNKYYAIEEFPYSSKQQYFADLLNKEEILLRYNNKYIELDEYSFDKLHEYYDSAYDE